MHVFHEAGIVQRAHYESCFGRSYSCAEKIILPRNRRRLLCRDLVGCASLSCSAGQARSHNSKLALRPIHHAAGQGVEELAGRCGCPFWRARVPRGSAHRRGLIRTRRGGSRSPIGGAARGGPAPRLRREHVEWRGPAEELSERGAAPRAGPHDWGARFGAPERLLGWECDPWPRGEGGRWAENSLAAKPARRPFPPPSSTLWAEASRSSSRWRDGDCCGDGSLSADGRELGKWRRRR